MTPLAANSDPHAARDALLRFGSAYGFFVAGLAILALTSGRMAIGMVLTGPVLAGVHLITLGWLSLSIFAALRVFSGVALGVSLDKRGVGNAQWIAWTAGIVLFAGGLAASSGLAIVLGLASLIVGVALFSVLVVPAYRRATRGALTRAYLTVALISLWVVLSIGVLAGLRRAGVATIGLGSGYLQAHILVAVFGWVGSTVVGVGAHLIPMFALSRTKVDWPLRVALPLFAAIPALGVIALWLPDPALRLGWGAAAIGSGLWIYQVALYAFSRIRKERDAGLGLAAVATILLGAAWPIALFSGGDSAFVALLIVGWLSLFTLGVFHRVVPFLFWFLRFSSGAGRGRIPPVRELTSVPLAAVTCGGSAVGALVWALGLGLASPATTTAGAVLLLVAVASAALQLPRLHHGGLPKAAPPPIQTAEVAP